MTYHHFIAQRGMEMRYIEYHTKRGAESLRDNMARKGWNCTSINGEKT